MQNKVIIDTNILVSALLSKEENSATILVVELMLSKKIIPIYNKDIIFEYIDVLFRPHFNIDEDLIYKILIFIARYGEEINSKKTKIKMVDESDRKFYDIVNENKDIFLITGNIKHFPKNKKILTAREFVEVYDKNI